MRTRIKLCGMTRVDDVLRAVDLGVDAIGIILVPGSKREVTLEQACRLSAVVPALVNVVVLFADADPERITQVLGQMRVDLLQFHGSETNSQCTMHRRPFIKAVAMGDDGTSPELSAWPDASALVLDGHRPGELGGQGRAFDWTRPIAANQQRLMLAGGLSVDNVAQAIIQMRPYAVDVSSGIESAPGIKDPRRMEAFISEVQRADRQFA